MNDILNAQIWAKCPDFVQNHNLFPIYPTYNSFSKLDKIWAFGQNMGTSFTYQHH